MVFKVKQSLIVEFKRFKEDAVVFFFFISLFVSEVSSLFLFCFFFSDLRRATYDGYGKKKNVYCAAIGWIDVLAVYIQRLQIDCSHISAKVVRSF